MSRHQSQTINNHSPFVCHSDAATSCLPDAILRLRASRRGNSVEKYGRLPVTVSETFGETAQSKFGGHYLIKTIASEGNGGQFVAEFISSSSIGSRYLPRNYINNSFSTASHDVLRKTDVYGVSLGLSLLNGQLFRRSTSA